MADKPSFLGSLASAAIGYVKGAIAGGLVGIAGGAAVGALVGLATGGLGAAVIGGAYIGGSVLASIGGLAGAVTDVVKYRSPPQPTMDDVKNVANAAYAQGMAVGQQIEQEREVASTRFRDQISRERTAMGVSQQIH